MDIIFANLMLARSTVHILGINHPYIACECGTPEGARLQGPNCHPASACCSSKARVPCGS